MKGQYLKENRPGFTGVIHHDCTGTMSFQDRSTTKIRYYEEKYQLVLGDEETGEGGIKVRTYSLWFIQINSLQYTNNKSNKNRETSDQKISNQ